MNWFIIDRGLHVLANPSTDAPESLPIYNDKQTVMLSNNCVVSTYDFDVAENHEDAQYLQVGNYIAFIDKYNKTRLYTLMSHDGDDKRQTWHAEDIGLDLINESSEKWDYTGQPHSIAWYYENLILNDSGWEIGVNEISTLTQALKFDGVSDTQLRRLGDVANQFDGAEVDFSIEMRGSKVTKQTVNIYKKIGSPVTQERYVDSVNLKSLTYSSSIENLVTALKPFGGTPEGQESRIDISGVFYDDGQFYSPIGHPYLYDREARQKWSRFKAYDSEIMDEYQGYIVGSYSYDTTDPEQLVKRAVTELKSRNKPEEVYEASLAEINADVGDYVQIAHSKYNPPIYLSARVEKVENCYTKKGQDVGTLGDYRRLVSQIDPRVKDLIQQEINGNKTYQWKRYASDDKGTNMTAMPTSDSKYFAILVNKQTSVPSDDPSDYAGHWVLIRGKDGTDGVPGQKGEDGRTSYTHFAYANNVSGTEDFSLDDPTGRSYMGVYTDFTQKDSTDPSLYTWSYTKGPAGPKGDKGDTGVGVAGPKGEDGRTPYTHTAWAWSADGVDGFTVGYPKENLFIGSDLKSMGKFTQYLPGKSTSKLENGVYTVNVGSDVGQAGLQIEDTKENLGLQRATNYAISIYCKGIGSMKITYRIMDLQGVWSGWTMATSSNKVLNNDWQRVDGTIKTPTTDFTKITITFYAQGTNSIVDSKHPKLEANGFATPWTPAPSEDYDAAYPAYRGEYVDYVEIDSATPADYTWTRILGPSGADGKDGLQGIQGPKGDQGIAGPKGPDGKSSYTHLAYANSADGKTDFSVSDTNRKYIGMYIDQVVTDSTDPTKYGWTLVKGADGAQGTAGKAGADGKTPYFHTAWADSVDGKTNFSTTDSTNRKYLGTVTDFTQADPTDPAKYSWIELVGALEIGGRNLILKSSDLSQFSTWTQEGVKPTVSDDKTEMTINSIHGGLNISLSNLSKAIPNSGSTIIISVEAKGNAHLQFNYNNGQNYMGGSNIAISSNFKRYYFKFVWNPVVLEKTNFVIFTADSEATQMVIRYPKIEIGNKATGWSPAPEDAVNDANNYTNSKLNEVNNLINSVPKLTTDTTAPANPKKGDLFWKVDANNDLIAMFKFNGTTWEPQTIQQSLLNIVSLNAVNINGSIINGSKFTNEFSYQNWAKETISGVTTIADGKVSIDYKVSNGNTGKTVLNAEGYQQQIFNSSGSMIGTSTLNASNLVLANSEVSGGYLTPEDLERVGPETWKTNNGVYDVEVSFLKQFRQAWMSGRIALPAATGESPKLIFTLLSAKFRPKSTRYITLSSLENVPRTAIIQIETNGRVSCISNSANLYTFSAEGGFYPLD